MKINETRITVGPAKSWRNRYDFYAWMLIIGLALFRMLYVNDLGCANDEVYYWVWSKHLSLGYYDHPPLIAFMIFLSTQIFGDTSLGIRMVIIVVSTISFCTIYYTGKLLFSPRVAWYTLVIMTANFLSILGGFIVTPDAPLILFWSFCLFIVALLVRHDIGYLWILLGFCLGMGLLGKYMMILFLPALILFSFSQPRYRYWLRKPIFYEMIVISFLSFLPVVIWNYHNHWISFGYQLCHGFSSKDHFTLKYFFEYLGGQMLLANPVLFICLVITSIQGLRNREKSSIAYLSWMTVIPLAFFGLSSIMSRTEANWPVTAYLSGSLLLGWWFDRKIHQLGSQSLRWKRLLWFSIGFNIFLAAFALLHIKVDLVTLPNDRTNEIFGWEELGSEISTIYHGLCEKHRTFIVATSHQLASQLSFNMQGHPRVYEDPIRGRTNFYTIVDDFSDKRGWSALYVASSRNDPWNILNASFSRCELIAEIPNRRNERAISAFTVYHAYDFQGQWSAYNNHEESV